MKNLILFTVLVLAACTNSVKKEQIQMTDLRPTESNRQAAIDSLVKKHGVAFQFPIQKGVRHTAALWTTSDGNATEFIGFCQSNFLADQKKKQLLFEKLSIYLESLEGHFNKITLDLRQNVDLNNGELLDVDKTFSGYSVGAHLQDDLYQNKIAFVVALNFPYFTLEDKERDGKNWNRRQWAEARLGDQFVSRIPAEVNQAVAKAEADADLYISEYNIKMGCLRTEENTQLFPDKMSLLTHWNLRDEIKADYADKDKGLTKQKMIYEVMQRIINQDIPARVINNPSYVWKPFSNKVFENNTEIDAAAEPDTRYQQILNNFHAQQAVDPFVPEMNTLIKRKFSGEMEIPVEEVEALFDNFLKSPELAKVGRIISERVGRPLEPFDIWYDGFKARSSFPQEQLNSLTTKKYPDPMAFEKDMPNMLGHLGWSKERAAYLAARIVVDPARGSGHAWGAGMKGEKSHLRTRIAPTGMDYKGYNIAVHEFGHNVEQTVSMYDVDYYMLHGVPSTAFTEALAFVFQSRDLMLLGLNGQNKDQERLNALDNSWTLMEIMGVGLVDIHTWQWMYNHPNASSKELKQSVIQISKEVWNKYFAAILGMKDQPILAIYSHMISNPLYLAAYSYGQIIESQIEDHLKGKNFPDEIDRVYKQGRLIPQIWMQGATGSKLSADPILKQLNEVLK